jgi:hypothetical protein
MVAIAQRLDARCFFFHPHVSVFIFLALAFKVCRNRSSCHSQSVAELARSKLATLGHSVTIHGPSRNGGGLQGFVSLYSALENRAGGSHKGSGVGN